MTTQDPNEGYVSRDAKDPGWVPVPTGMKRLVVAMNVPENVEDHELALMLDLFAGEGEPKWDADSTVWNEPVDFIKDWEEGQA